jgi:DNA polymerase-3 subunit alpha
MGILEKLKMLKVDFLGLATLTIMARACKSIEERHGIHYTLDNIPTDDPATFKFLGEGNTLGVFQLEGSGMTKWLVQMKPTCLDHIVAMVALYRPGPMDFIPDYISRMHGEAEIEYRHPSLEPIFGETYGIPLYQEQLMRAAIELAGFTPSESDELRAAISKKKNKEIEKQRLKFVEGAAKQGMERATAEAIYHDWDEFARYGFNKSHAADYGLLAVQTGFLKLHYPVEYMTALLSVTKHETEKMALYVNDARNMGVTVLSPDINASTWDFAIEELDASSAATGQAGKFGIRFGLGAIKNVGQGAVELPVQARRKDGPFKDLNDLSARVDLRAVGKRALESLIKVGALDKFGPRSAMLEALDRVVAVSSSHFRAAEAGQLSLFGTATGVTENITLPLVPDADRRETLGWERELIGMYMSEHPLTPYMNEIRRLVTHFSSNLGEAEHEEKARVAGMVSGIRPYQTKTGKMMAWVTLEDLTGVIELVLFPRTWEKYQFALEVGGVIVAEGKVDAQSNPSKVLVENIRTEIKLTQPAQIPLQPQPQPSDSGKNNPPAPGQRNGGTSSMIPAAGTGKPANAARHVSIPRPSITDEPPEPETPPDWDDYSPEGPGMAVQVAVTSMPAPAVDLPEDEITSSPNPVGSASGDVVAQPEPVLPLTVVLTPKLPAATLPLSIEDEHAPHMVTVILRPSGDPNRDIRRISRLHGTFISYPGKDRFAFQIFEEGRGHLIEFPNDSTHLCAELAALLTEAIGEENVRIEPILYQ